MNNCRRQQEAISLMAAGLCPETERRRAEQHTQDCAECRAYLRELKEITGAFSRLKDAGAKATPRAELRARWTSEVLAGGPASSGENGRGSRVVLGSETWFPVRRPWLSWGLATAACIWVAFYLGYRHGRTEPADPLANVALVRQTLAMFPNRVRAIVEDGRGLNLVLSDTDNIPNSAALYIRVCDGRRCSSFLTFSGQEITVGGQPVTVLEDAQGGVILAGNAFVWSSEERSRAGDRWQIEAKNFGPANL